MEPITMAIVIAYFLLRRGGENAMWLARKDGTDPPSFRRWQERQKRRGARGSVTGRAEGRKFWAHVWHDAHASAHEWRQRRRGRAWEDRRKRWQAEDVQRKQNLPLAPCVFCGAGRGENCRDDCPEVQAHGANRANSGRATEPPKPEVTKPSDGTAPSQQGATVPPAPSHTGGTVPPATEPSDPEPSQATEPTAAGTVVLAAPGRASLFKSDEEELAFKERYLQEMKEAFNAIRDQCTDDDVAEHAKSCRRLENRIRELRQKLGKDQHPKVTPIDKNKPAANRQAGNGNTSGGNVTTPNVTGEIQGYEATLAEMDQTIAHLEVVHADADQKVHAFEGYDAVYETRIDHLRHTNADEETIGTQVAAREANEVQISAAKAQLEAASAHLEAELAARARWIEGQGAMKDTGDAVGARGDQVLRD